MLEEWELKGFYPYVPLLGKSLETGEDLLGITPWIPASVPGSVHSDLLKAGWIEDPYFGMNSILCEWVENRWWIYRTKFDFEPIGGKAIHLCFQGLDYKAHIYLNHQLLVVHEGMFTPVSIDVTDILQTEGNELIVMFEHAPDAMGQIGYTSQTKPQKSRFSYKWDFSARIVPLGFWDEVFLQITENLQLQDTWLQPELKGESGILRVVNEIKYRNETPAESGSVFIYKVDIFKDGDLVCTSEQLYETPSQGSTNCELELVIDRPALWYPNGSGDQPLYKVMIQLWENDRLSDQWDGMTGFRSLTWEQNEGAA